MLYLISRIPIQKDGWKDRQKDRYTNRNKTKVDTSKYEQIQIPSKYEQINSYITYVYICM